MYNRGKYISQRTILYSLVCAVYIAEVKALKHVQKRVYYSANSGNILLKYRPMSIGPSASRGDHTVSSVFQCCHIKASTYSPHLSTYTQVPDHTVRLGMHLLSM